MLPSFIRHGVFTNIVYFILCYIVRYRRKVMMGNLERSFPDKSHKEINTLCKRAYYNLAEQIINTISMSGISEKELLRRMEIPDAERIRKEMAGQNVVFMMGHYGPWEAGLAISLTFPEQRLVAVYHKLSNRVMDELFKRIRQLPNVDLVDMKRTMRYFIDKRDKQQMIKTQRGVQICLGISSCTNGQRSSTAQRCLPQNTSCRYITSLPDASRRVNILAESYASTTA